MNYRFYITLLAAPIIEVNDEYVNEGMMMIKMMIMMIMICSVLQRNHKHDDTRWASCVYEYVNEKTFIQ